MSHLNQIYHKGKFRCGEWSKHLRPYLKREGNKRWRKTAKDFLDEDVVMHRVKVSRLKRTIKVRITTRTMGNRTITRTNKYRTMRDAQNAMNRGNVVRASILEK